MTDLQFEKCVEFSRDFDGLDQRILTEHLKYLSATFSSNILRVKSLGYLPLEMNFWSSAMSSCIVQALMMLKKRALTERSMKVQWR